jgi:hypothetical protein
MRERTTLAAATVLVAGALFKATDDHNPLLERSKVARFHRPLGLGS